MSGIERGPEDRDDEDQRERKQRPDPRPWIQRLYFVELRLQHARGRPAERDSQAARRR